MRTTESSPCQPTASSGLNAIGDQRHLAAPLDLDHPRTRLGLLGGERSVKLRHIEQRRVEDRVVPDQALVRKHVARVRRLDQQKVHRRGAVDAPHRAARHDHVVAGLYAQVPEIAVQIALAGMHEQQLIAVGVAGQSIHAGAEAPESDAAVGVRREPRARTRDRSRPPRAATRSKARGCSGPVNSLHPVGGWR